MKFGLIHEIRSELVLTAGSPVDLAADGSGILMRLAPCRG